MFKNLQSRPINKLIICLVVAAALISACSPVISTPVPTVEPSATMLPEATQAPVETGVPEATQAPAMDNSFEFSMDTGSIASGYQSETIPAVTDTNNNPYWAVLPEYTKLTLQGYPITSHLMQPQIFIYPVEELVKINEGAGMIVNSLETLIQSPQEIPNMPFLPLFNAAQVMHAHVQFLDFKNGQGVRYITEFDQAFVPINNYELIYTYQGLTSDGKYYVAAVLPINHPDLPADGMVTGKEPPEFTNDFPAYLADVVKMLNPQAANTFTPDLTQLDAMMSSIEIK